MPFVVDVAEQLGDVDRGAVAVCVARKIEKVVDRGFEPVDRLEQISECSACVALRRHERVLDRDADARDRCPELMRRVGAERALPGEELAEALRGCVHGRAELVELSDAGAGAPDGEVARAQSFGRLDQRVDRTGQASRLPPGEEAGDREGDERGKGHEQPRVARPVADDVVGAARAQHADDAFVAVYGNRNDDAIAFARVVHVTTQRQSHRTVGASRAAARDLQAGGRVERKLDRSVGGQLDAVATGELPHVDDAPRLTRFPLEGQHRLVSVETSDGNSERYAEHEQRDD